MVPNPIKYYVVDESANFIDANAETKTDTIYFERDTGKYKLGNGDRYCDIKYLANLTEVISRIKHTHSVSDIKNLKLPQGVEYPNMPNGEYVLYDNGKFGPIKTDKFATAGSKNPISSGWAATHESSNTHLTPQQLDNFHLPASVSGAGITINDQTISLSFGRGPRDVCPGSHDHSEYTPRKHVHAEKIPPSRLPSISRDEAGAVPPTGSPSGKCLHDDGSWKHVQLFTTINIDDYWVSPLDGELILISMYANKAKSSSLTINTKLITHLVPVSTKLHGFHYAAQWVKIPFKAGDVFQASIANMQIGIVYTR